MATPKYTSEIERFWSKIAITADDNQCWLWIDRPDTNGYGRFYIDCKMTYAHRLAWIYPDYIIPDGMFICHSCDNPTCCNPKHLFLGTNQDNIKDRHSKNRSAKGEGIASHRLTDKMVIEIRAKYSTGDLTIAALAREYGVSFVTVESVVKMETWKHVQSS